MKVSDFEMPTYDQVTGTPCIQKRTGLCPCMMLYAMDEMFHIFRGVGANDVNGQCIVAYKILALASLLCLHSPACGRGSQWEDLEA